MGWISCDAGVNIALSSDSLGFRLYRLLRENWQFLTNHDFVDQRRQRASTGVIVKVNNADRESCNGLATCTVSFVNVC